MPASSTRRKAMKLILALTTLFVCSVGIAIIVIAVLSSQPEDRPAEEVVKAEKQD